MERQAGLLQWTVHKTRIKQLKGKNNPRPCFTKHESFHNPAPACFSSTAFQSPPPLYNFRLSTFREHKGLFAPSQSLQILCLPGRTFSLPSTGGCLQSFQDLGKLNHMKAFLMLSVSFFLHIIKITHFVYSSMDSDQHRLTYLPQSR